MRAVVFFQMQTSQRVSDATDQANAPLSSMDAALAQEAQELGRPVGRFQIGASAGGQPARHMTSPRAAAFARRHGALLKTA